MRETEFERADREYRESAVALHEISSEYVRAQNRAEYLRGRYEKIRVTYDQAKMERRILALEAEGMTRSDAQGVVEAEDIRRKSGK